MIENILWITIRGTHLIISQNTISILFGSNWRKKLQLLFFSQSANLIWTKQIIRQNRSLIKIFIKPLGKFDKIEKN